MKTLLDIEEIRSLKARYFRFLDYKQWDQLKQCFTKDFTAITEGPHPDITFNSPDEFISTNSEILKNVPTVHQGHTSEIELLSADKARGVWSMYDRVELPDSKFEGWGYYHEDYVRVDGEWKIAHMHLKRLIINPFT